MQFSRVLTRLRAYNVQWKNNHALDNVLIVKLFEKADLSDGSWRDTLIFRLQSYLFHSNDPSITIIFSFIDNAISAYRTSTILVGFHIIVAVIYLLRLSQSWYSSRSYRPCFSCLISRAGFCCRRSIESKVASKLLRPLDMLIPPFNVSQ
jgi:hypothetical protein